MSVADCNVSLPCIHIPVTACFVAAGIQAIKLEELERRLRTDIMQEAIAWAGRVMLHKEVSIVDLPAAREPASDQRATTSKHASC